MEETTTELLRSKISFILLTALGFYLSKMTTNCGQKSLKILEVCGKHQGKTVLDNRLENIRH